MHALDDQRDHHLKTDERRHGAEACKNRRGYARAREEGSARQQPGKRPGGKDGAREQNEGARSERGKRSRELESHDANARQERIA